MHIGTLWAARSRRLAAAQSAAASQNVAGAGVGVSPDARGGTSRDSSRDAADRGPTSLTPSPFCFWLPCRLLPAELLGPKLHAWCVLAFLVAASVCCIGLFEAARLSTHVLRSPCTITSHELYDVGACTLCDGESPANCEVFPVATARLSVTFRPLHSSTNITGRVWYCKGLAAADPCRRQLQFLDQLSLDIRTFGGVPHRQIPCTIGEVLAYTQRHEMNGPDHQCYYSSRDPEGEDVWLTMPSPGLVDHAWFQKHLGYPVLLALGGLVLLSVLLGCLALEGAELWAAGLV